jgi:hypothetical protein
LQAAVGIELSDEALFKEALRGDEMLSAAKDTSVLGAYAS